MTAPLAVALAALDWLTALILTGAALRHSSVALRERAIAALLLALAASFVAVLRANADLGNPLSEPERVALVLIAMVAMSVPGVLFLVLFLRDDFGR